MNELASKVICAAVGAFATFKVVNGFRKGRMEFGFNSVSVESDRSKDPRGFWTNVALNVVIIAIAVGGFFGVIDRAP
jgi:hypothetical protein